MDLSNLSSDLPATKPIDQISVNEINQELTNEFKNAARSVAALYNCSGQDHKETKVEFANAAKSVAALYRLSNNSNTLLLNKGYLECIDDLLEAITQGQDIENWALTKRAEMTNVNSETASENTEDVIPADHEFSVKLDLSPGYKFRQSMPPMSVTHSPKFRSILKNFKKKNHESLMRRKFRQSQPQDDSTSSDEDSEDESSQEESFVSQKLRRYHDNNPKKKRRVE